MRPLQLTHLKLYLENAIELEAHRHDTFNGHGRARGATERLLRSPFHGGTKVTCGRVVPRLYRVLCGPRVQHFVNESENTCPHSQQTGTTRVWTGACLPRRGCPNFATPERGAAAERSATKGRDRGEVLLLSRHRVRTYGVRRREWIAASPPALWRILGARPFGTTCTREVAKSAARRAAYMALDTAQSRQCPCRSASAWFAR